MSSSRPRRWLRLVVAAVLLPLPAIGLWGLAKRIAVPKHTVIVRNRTARSLSAVRASIGGAHSESVQLGPGEDRVLEWRARSSGAYGVSAGGARIGDCGPGDARRWVATVGPADRWSCDPL